MIGWRYGSLHSCIFSELEDFNAQTVLLLFIPFFLRFRSDKGKSKNPKVLEEGPGEAKSDICVKDEANGSTPHLVKEESAFNITQAVDRCQLWQNMVRNLDSPIPSPRKKAHHRTNTQQNSSSNFAPGDEKNVASLAPGYQSTTV